MKNNQQRQLLDLVDLYSSLQIKKKKKTREEQETLPVATDGHYHNLFYNIGKSIASMYTLKEIIKITCTTTCTRNFFWLFGVLQNVINF